MLGSRQRVNNALETLPGLPRNSDYAVVIGQTKSRHRIHRHHLRSATLAIRIDHHVTWQQQSDVPLGQKGAVRELWVACAKDYVRSEVDFQLVLERRFDVQFAENAEAFRRKRSFCPFDGVTLESRTVFGNP